MEDHSCMHWCKHCTDAQLMVIEWFLSKELLYQYDEFGIEIPADYTVHGIDVSNISTYRLGECKSHDVEDVQISFAFIKQQKAT